MVAVASGFQTPEVRIPCLWNLDSGFQSFAGSLIIQDGLTTDSKAQDAGFHMQTFPRFWIPQAQISPTPESGVPDMGQSTDSYWIVRT